MKHKEDDEQQAFFDWVRVQQLDGNPLSDICFAIPNGGNRNAREAGRMKSQGVKAGVLDIFMAVPSSVFHGLWIEMKAGDKKMSEDQEKFKAAAESRGFMCVICYSAEDAIDEVKLYLAGCKETPVAEIREVNGQFKYKAMCRRMRKFFKTRQGAVGWLRRRGFDEFGARI